YKSEHNPSGLNEADLPPFAYIEEERDKLKSVGDTSLSDGQLKQIIKHKHVVAAKFLDNDDSWHCFFFTYKALRGEEGSQPPHLHYISSAWNIERSEVIAQLREKNYHLPALPHINYHTHRNPREEEE